MESRKSGEDRGRKWKRFHYGNVRAGTYHTSTNRD
jgi:hypothetical protein